MSADFFGAPTGRRTGRWPSEQVIDVEDPPGGGELGASRGQDPADRRDGGGARVAGLGGQRRQVEGDHVTTCNTSGVLAKQNIQTYLSLTS